MTEEALSTNEIDPFEQMAADKARAYNQGLTPLHPPQEPLLRVSSILTFVPILIGAGVLDFILQNEIGLPFGSIIGPIAVLAAFVITFLPHRVYRRWGYDMGDEQLRILRGFMWRTDTIVPFNRIQHIDVAQGPLQRMFGLSALVVHTAGTHNSIVTLPGLATADAEAMRDTIKIHIRKDMI